MVIIDSHQHFWNPEELDLSSLPDDLNRSYMPGDLLPELKRAGVDYTVFVQGFPQTLETNKWYFTQANANPFVMGVVAWADLMNPDRLGSQLDDLQAESKFVGIRHVVESEPDLNWIVREPVIESLKEMARRQIPFDMVINPSHLENVINVLDKIPDLPTVIDHIAKPNIAHGGSLNWLNQLTEIASHDNVYCKLSGMVTEAKRETWTVEDLRPYVGQVIDIFGFERLMYGSDWPVCLLAADYQQVWSTINELLSEIDSASYSKVFGGNAIKFYRLGVS